MCKIPDPPKPRNCKCGHQAVYGNKCGHCYIRLVLDPLEKRSRNSKLVIGAPGRCPHCDSISMQRVTTWGTSSDVIFVEKVEGKKPYLIQCRKCKRQWKTAAEYARHLSGDAYRIQKKTT